MSTMFNPGPSPYGASNGPLFRREGPSSPHVPADYYPTYYHPAGVHSFFKNDQSMYYPPSMEFSSGVFDPRQLPPFPHPDFIKYQSVVQRVPGIEAIQCRWNENGKECGLLFASSADITVHLVHHHIAAIDTTLHLCAWTNCARAHRAFKAKYKLVNHVRVHTGERPFVCNKCDKDFARAENLKIHMRTHTGEKPFKCTHPNCGRTFANSSDRKKHMHVHTTEKPYLCKVKGCEKTYTHPSSLRKHMKMHEKNGEYGPEMDESCDSGHASSTTPVDDFSPKQENEYIMPRFDVSPQTSLPQPQPMQPLIMDQHQAHLLQDHQQQEQQLHQLYPHNPMPLQPCQPQFTTLSNAPPGFSMAADLYKFPY